MPWRTLSHDEGDPSLLKKWAVRVRAIFGQGLALVNSYCASFRGVPSRALRPEARPEARAMTSIEH